ncbi:TonB-dependent receptor [Alteromonas facilis]|uniref:TonB-dependent receptor n=1 Tax=Alteromonas facilis TaxID=2048004 RepID=UPI000C286E1B|nr:TonB-dependent receptor [Alteromonas facilis]
MTFKFLSFSVSSALILSHSVIAPALAQTNDTLEPNSNDIERIIVSSDFRQVTLDQLSASASILSAARIEQRQGQHIDALLGSIPNVNFASGASRGRFIQIRGIGERSQFSEPLNPSVSFTLDDIDLTGLFALATPFDIAQLEVLRGPQATEFGIGALAGAINMRGTAPGGVVDNQLLLSYASQQTWRVGIAAGGDLGKQTGYRASWVEQRSDGDIVNTFLNRDDTNNIHEQAGRLAFSSMLNAANELVVNYRYFNIDNGYDAFSLDNDRKTRSDEPGFDRNKTHAFSARLTTQMDSADVISILSVSDSDLGYGYDEDWTFDGFHPYGYSSFDAYFRDVSSKQIELRAVSNKPWQIAGLEVDWLLGTVYRDREESLLRDYTYAASDFTSEYSPSTFALYTRFDTQLSSRMGMQWGLRVERSSLHYSDNSGFKDDSNETLLGGKFALNYAIAGGLLYGSISRGYKTAGFNPDERVSENARLYEPEYNWNYEVGLKRSVLDGSGNLRIAIFYMDRENTQIADFDTLERDNGSTDFIDIIANADVGTNQGIEFESQWQLSDAWSVNVNLGYLEATFEGYQTSDGEFVNKQKQAQSPEWSANVLSSLAITNNVQWRIELDINDEYRFSDGHDVTSPGYALVDTSIEWQINEFDVQFWVKNLFDRTYYVRGFGGFSNDPRDGYETPVPYYQFGQQRQFGVTLNWQF